METIFRSYRPSSGERSDRSAGDRLRHRQKVREAIRHNIADIIAEESIIGKDRDRIIKVPIRGVKEYRFVYGENTTGVGQGGEGTEPGQVIGQGKEKGGPWGPKAGSRPCPGSRSPAPRRGTSRSRGPPHAASSSNSRISHS